MATIPCVTNSISRRRLSLAAIDAAVSARLGPTRTLGNAQPACFNRQVAIYLARHLGGWSTTFIGRFYNDRDHSTVCYGIQRIEALRENDPDVDALLTELKQQLSREGDDANCGRESDSRSTETLDQFAELVAERVCAYLERRRNTHPGVRHNHDFKTT
jgi:hypothetical protein